jgi:hypothetical protein
MSAVERRAFECSAATLREAVSAIE